jgi:hypothetical protein
MASRSSTASTCPRKRETIKRWHAEAAAAGKGAEFLRTLRHVCERLRAEPGQFGEPLYHLSALKLQVRQAVIGRLAGKYGVHQERPLVFVRWFRLLD